MKRIFTIFFLICFLFSLSGCYKVKKNVADDGSTITTEDNNAAKSYMAANGEKNLQELSERLALQMVEGNFEDTYEKCSKVVKPLLDITKLKEKWSVCVSGMGKFMDVYKITEDTKADNQVVDVLLRYEYCGLKVSFVYNVSTQLDGFWLYYSPIEENAISTDTYEETKITFGGEEYPVTGILTLPKNVTNPPVAILVPGSGNHDVNETVGANKPFRDIAWELAEQGIASIRYNERAFLYQEFAVGEFTIEIDSLNDAADVINYALNSDKIDKRSIFVVGHSLGALMAPKIAFDNPGVAGIVLLAGSPRKLEDVIYDQVQYSVKNTQGVTETQAEKAISDTEDVVETIRNLPKGNLDVILGYPSSYWYSLNQIDNAGLASELTIPIMIAQGSEDWQIFADIDFVAWQELLGNKDNVTFKLYDNLNHFFMISNGKTDITEYDIPGHVELTVIDDVATWIKSN